ncbi:Txe/YoeB family addiction module toxin [Pontibacterium sp. N1Y112]|uniref:Toxin YoeB n=1 Tax=Pontibacterium sinense TaxID=2781979 RepID=A0A8J7K6T8_9GAMM|nr:Txe/YoeB family addiction module toxin [Pontibacterium sinense]MBE9397451.1 Txe/YoeB family addiction module toxin [Pontibacterium sinense]
MIQSKLLVLQWDDHAWEDYLYWQKTDKKTLKRINELIKSTRRGPFEGLGKPEALKGDLSGFWSRRIDREHRMVYTVQDGVLIIAACRYHYS